LIDVETSHPVPLFPELQVGHYLILFKRRCKDTTFLE
jgi:hypothetical protein